MRPLCEVGGDRLPALRRRRTRIMVPNEAHPDGVPHDCARAPPPRQNDVRLPEADPLFPLPHHPVRGARLALCAEALPKHAPVHLLRAEVRQRDARAQVQGEGGDGGVHAAGRHGAHQGDLQVHERGSRRQGRRAAGFPDEAHGGSGVPEPQGDPQVLLHLQGRDKPQENEPLAAVLHVQDARPAAGGQLVAGASRGAAAAPRHEPAAGGPRPTVGGHRHPLGPRDHRGVQEAGHPLPRGDKGGDAERPQPMDPALLAPGDSHAAAPLDPDVLPQAAGPDREGSGRAADEGRRACGRREGKRREGDVPRHGGTPEGTAGDRPEQARGLARRGRRGP
mmetsp:Transcript_61425/g.180201  ORF Transcript_61425/g.180201 Transcript_61425/m.180201 type:complete len:336 (-) Transcript_61425:618-1625(-)